MNENNVIVFYEYFLFLILASKVLICESSETVPKPMSVIVHKDVWLDQEYVKVINPPSVLTNASNLKVQYSCSGQKIISVEIEAVIKYNYKDVHSKLFHKSWKCSKGALKTRNIPLKLNEKIVFRPDFINTDLIFIDDDSVIIRAWILNTDILSIAKQNDDGYKRARVKAFYLSSIPPPFSRPQRKVYNSCLSWRYTVLVSLSVLKIKTCPYENEVADFLKYPLSLNGLQYGVYRSVNKYMNNELEYKRVQLVNKPRFTITVWVYILEYCARSLCSIVHRAMWNGTYNTPLIFVTKKGNLHIQVSLTNGETRAAITDITIPRHQWVRLVFVFDRKKWKLTFNYGKEFNQTKSTEFSFDSAVYMDDTEGLFVIGGSDTTPGFSGFIGKLQWYRNKAVESDQIAYPDPHHPMFQLDFVNREIMCQRFKERNQRLFSAYKTKRNTISAEDTCQQFLYRYIQQGNQMEMINKCLQSDEPIPKYHKHIRRIMKYQAAMKNTFILTDANRMLYEKGVKLMEKGLRSVKAALPILKQSACFGNYDAMFMVSVILNNGIGVKADEIQSQAYLLLAARGQHRLSSLSLGHKHMYGLDGVPVDKEQAYPYLKYVADTTREDKEIYKNTDVYTESIRLTDEDQIKQQTDEDGDIFHWLKFQAKKGVLSAQQNIGRALFWGSQGLKRNIHTALQYLRMSAETEDAQSMYDYGIILLRGHGTSVNETEAMTHIKKSAEKKNPSALNALGWYALNYDRNTTEAVKYFEEAYSLGCPDAAYNLGILHLTGGFPGKTVDADKALAYFNFAGARNQIDAGIQVASLNMKGTSRHRRHIQIGVEWARFIAEKNPALGLVLRKALKAYRNLDLQSSLFYYLMASDAGLEVASFNSAYLCESSQDGMATVIEKDCQWRNYNLSTLREKQFVHAYSLIKMGDFYWYGCGKKQNIEKAADYYTQAALKGDPHALFNLGFMIEEDSKLTDDFWIKLKIPLKDRIERNRLLKSLYTRKTNIRESRYFVCTLRGPKQIITDRKRTKDTIEDTDRSLSNIEFTALLLIYAKQTIDKIACYDCLDVCKRQVVGFVVVSVMAIFSVVMIYRHTNGGTEALLRTTI